MKGISKASITEVKSLASPPQDVFTVLGVTAILLGHSEAEAKV